MNTMKEVQGTVDSQARFLMINGFRFFKFLCFLAAVRVPVVLRCKRKELNTFLQTHFHVCVVNTTYYFFYLVTSKMANKIGLFL